MRWKRNSTVLVGIGANLPSAIGDSPLASCQRAVAALAGLPGLHLVATSRWYVTPSEPLGAGAPDYVNGVARLAGPPGDPAALLAQLHRIEAAAGRSRSWRNAPRILDLDLIDAWGLVRDAPDPVLPHPRAVDRRFVLVPLRDVWPDWRHPSSGAALAALLAALPAGPEPRAI
jgi:2-amino-4-hydroxy-6-hydroxymethyldihydropteridine diphosphokinase